MHTHTATLIVLYWRTTIKLVKKGKCYIEDDGTHYHLNGKPVDDVGTFYIKDIQPI